MRGVEHPDFSREGPGFESQRVHSEGFQVLEALFFGSTFLTRSLVEHPDFNREGPGLESQRVHFLKKPP